MLTLFALAAPALAQDMDADGFDASVDCDDTSAAIFPGGADPCGDGIDGDCDGVDPSCDPDGDGWDVGDDCDNQDPTIYPGAEEVCDGVDNDCDEDVDETGPPEQLVTYYRDDDGDGYGDTPRGYCPGAQPTTYVELGGDCDDRDETSHPGAVELCDDLADNDCNGVVDEGCEDLDGDGWNVRFDCDDTNPDVNYDAEEQCNGIDDDCDFEVDEGCPTAPTDTDLPTDTADAEPDTKSSGCGGGRALVLLLPIGLLGRRRARHSSVS